MTTMPSSFNDWSRLVTKHVLDDPAGFNELVNRLKVCEHAGSKACAAAIGFLIGKEGSSVEEEEHNVYADVVDIVETVDAGHMESCEATDKIFVTIYQWIDKTLAEDGYPEAEEMADGDYNVRMLIKEAFANKMPPL